MRKRETPVASSRRGFTLLEIIIAVAVLSVLVGAVLPVASNAFQSKAKRITRDEQVELADAAVEYFRDVHELPDSVADLLYDPGDAGWNGPYMTALSTDPLSNKSDREVDAWSRPYVFQALDASRLQITSAGPDGAVGTAADIVRTLDVTPVRREETRDRLRTVNQAILLYNGNHLPDEPLPTSYDQIVTRLVSAGFLPDDVGFRLDGWGDEFVPDPPGLTPVVAVASSNF